MGEGRPVSISVLLSSGVALRPHEAVAIVSQLCDQLSSRPPAPGIAPAISAGTVTIDGSGAVAVAGGFPAEDEQTVLLAGRLMLEMLDHSVGALDAAVPARLRSTAVGAAMGGRAAFSTVAALVSALRRDGPPSSETQSIRGVFERWAAWKDGRREVAAAEAARPEGPDRRRNAPPSDTLRRFLREAEQEAYRVRVEASSQAVPAGVDAAASGVRSRWRRVARLALVGALLLLLAGAGFVFALRGSKEELPFVAPVSKPTPVQPRREPGWELLGRPQRADAGQPSGVRPSRAARRGQSTELTAPQWDPTPGR